MTSIKFLLLILMLCKTQWSWELRTWSHKKNLLDILSTSPHYFCRKWIGATNENSNFDIRVLRVNDAREELKPTSVWTIPDRWALTFWIDFEMSISQSRPAIERKSRISSVGRALDCRAGGRGFDFRSRTNTQGLKITEKWRYFLRMARVTT